MVFFVIIKSEFIKLIFSYLNKDYDRRINYGYKKQSSLLAIIIALIVILGVAIFIFLLGRSTKKESEVVITESTFEVKGMYGESFNLSLITNIELKETIPTIIKKVNGAGLGDIRKGNYILEELGECLMYVHSANGPYVIINVDNQIVIINYYEGEKTRSLYQNLLNAWQNE